MAFEMDAEDTAAPVSLARPGRIRRRQTTYWDLDGGAAADPRLRVRFVGKAELRYEQAEFPSGSLELEHPLLRDYDATFVSLYISRPARDPDVALRLLTRLVERWSAGWRSLERYQNSLVSPSALLRAGFGQLLAAPRGLAQEAESLLAEQGCGPTIAGEYRVENRPRLLLLGRNFIIAERFEFETGADR